jgi:Domain of unknown function (DUF6471)
MTGFRQSCQTRYGHICFFLVGGDLHMRFAESEAEIAERVARYVKAELKHCDVTYDELAERLKEHGLTETRNSIAAKLKRGTFPATFLLAVMAAIGRENISLGDV